MSKRGDKGDVEMTYRDPRGLTKEIILIQALEHIIAKKDEEIKLLTEIVQAQSKLNREEIKTLICTCEELFKWKG